MTEELTFEVHTESTAPDESKPLLEHSQKLYGGMIPNLHGVMAESPALLEAYPDDPLLQLHQRRIENVPLPGVVINIG